MNKRSNIWKKRHTKLRSKEDALKNELELVSTDLENKTKSILKIAAISTGVLVLGYGIYKMASSSKDKEEEITETDDRQYQPKKVVVKEASGFNLKNLVIERLAILLIQQIGKRLGNAISDKISDEVSSED